MREKSNTSFGKKPSDPSCGTKITPPRNWGGMKGFDYGIVSHAYSIQLLLFISHVLPYSQLRWRQDLWDALSVSAILVHTFLPFSFPVWVREKTRTIHQSTPPEPRVITRQIAHFPGDDASATGYIKVPGCKTCSPGHQIRWLALESQQDTLILHVLEPHSKYYS